MLPAVRLGVQPPSRRSARDLGACDLDALADKVVLFLGLAASWALQITAAAPSGLGALGGAVPKVVDEEGGDGGPIGRGGGGEDLHRRGHDMLGAFETGRLPREFGEADVQSVQARHQEGA